MEGTLFTDGSSSGLGALRRAGWDPVATDAVGQLRLAEYRSVCSNGWSTGSRPAATTKEAVLACQERALCGLPPCRRTRQAVVHVPLQSAACARGAGECGVLFPRSACGPSPPWEWRRTRRSSSWELLARGQRGTSCCEREREREREREFWRLFGALVESGPTPHLLFPSTLLAQDSSVKEWQAVRLQRLEKQQLAVDTNREERGVALHRLCRGELPRQDAMQRLQRPRGKSPTKRPKACTRAPRGRQGDPALEDESRDTG